MYMVVSMLLLQMSIIYLRLFLKNSKLTIILVVNVGSITLRLSYLRLFIYIRVIELSLLYDIQILWSGHWSTKMHVTRLAFNKVYIGVLRWCRRWFLGGSHGDDYGVEFELGKALIGFSDANAWVQPGGLRCQGGGGLCGFQHSLVGCLVS